jgi:predicted secreted protein
MKDLYKNWTFDEYLTFIMYYAAMADFTITPEEKDMMLQTIGIEKFNEVKVFHTQNTDYENIQAIYYFKEKYCTDDLKLQKVHDVIIKMFDVDGDYNFYEKNMKRALDMLLG